MFPPKAVNPESHDHIVARLANLSFEHATFPAKFKIVQVTPLLKKQGLDTRDRPVTDRFPILTQQGDRAAGPR